MIISTNSLFSTFNISNFSATDRESSVGRIVFPNIRVVGLTPSASDNFEMLSPLDGRAKPFSHFEIMFVLTPNASANSC